MKVQFDHGCLARDPGKAYATHRDEGEIAELERGEALLLIGAGRCHAYEEPPKAEEPAKPKAEAQAPKEPKESSKPRGAK